MEVLLISQAKVEELMNRRGEWGQNLPPKLEINAKDRISDPNFTPKAVHKRKFQHTHSKTQVRESEGNVKSTRNKRARLDQDAPKNTPQDQQTRANFSTPISCDEGGAVNVSTEQKMRLNDKNNDISLYFKVIKKRN